MAPRTKAKIPIRNFHRQVHFTIEDELPVSIGPIQGR